MCVAQSRYRGHTFWWAEDQRLNICYVNTTEFPSVRDASHEYNAVLASSFNFHSRSLSFHHGVIAASLRVRRSDARTWGMRESKLYTVACEDVPQTINATLLASPANFRASEYLRSRWRCSESITITFAGNRTHFFAKRESFRSAATQLDLHSSLDVHNWEHSNSSEIPLADFDNSPNILDFRKKSLKKCSFQFRKI